MNRIVHQAFEENDNKFLFQIEGIDMHEDNFSATLIRGDKSITYEKSDFVMETVVTPGQPDTYNYYLCFNSDDFGPGTVTCIVRAWKPDTDFDGGVRKLVDQFEIEIVKPLKKVIRK